MLPLFALVNNSKKVHAMDSSDTLPTIASKMFEDNGNNTADEDKIQLKHDEIEDITTDAIKEPVDAIIIEWMGHALLFESILPSALLARDIFLKLNTGKLCLNDYNMCIEGTNPSSSMSCCEIFGNIT